MAHTPKLSMRAALADCAEQLRMFLELHEDDVDAESAYQHACAVLAAEKKAPPMPRARVLIEVYGGVADYQVGGDCRRLSVKVVDYDNAEAEGLDYDDVKAKADAWVKGGAS